MDIFKSIIDPPTSYTAPHPRPLQSQPPRPPPQHRQASSSSSQRPPARPPKIPLPPSHPLTHDVLPWSKDEVDEDVVSQRFDDVMSMMGTSADDAQSLYILESYDNSAHRSVKRTGLRSMLSSAYFDKVLLYENSRLPSDLPSLLLPKSTWRNILLAARYSADSYSSSSSRKSVIASDWRSNTKAMLVKVIPNEPTTTIVLAIRGTSSLRDWTTNMQYGPEPPVNFLADQGNAVHGGFLAVARSMMPVVAEHLQKSIQKQSLSPEAASAYNLIITGHSAGGAIAALLYSHMLSTVDSPLSELSGLFHRIHCVTFGAPPISLLPLTTHHQKSLFLSFINEGDAISRAEVPYMRSLLDLLYASAPKRKETWPVPESVFCNAGKIIILRQRGNRKRKMDRLDGLEMVICKEQDLHKVIWGDPVCHLMDVYKDRVSQLAGKS